MAATADVAIGGTCPRDGSFLALAGVFADEFVHGQCPVCTQTVSAPNPAFSQAMHDARMAKAAAEQAEADAMAPAPEPVAAPVEVGETEPAEEDDEHA
jgi:hypothetical protein